MSERYIIGVTIPYIPPGYRLVVKAEMINLDDDPDAEMLSGDGGNAELTFEGKTSSPYQKYMILEHPYLDGYAEIPRPD